MNGQKMNLKKLKFDKSWTLFLDRDGVINERIEGDYVCRWEQFRFLPDFLDSIKGLSDIFGKIIIVTNQRCIAKGLITEKELENIHANMLDRIGKTGADIDKIYFCPHEEYESCGCRKPETGMAIRAKEDFKDIDFLKSVMIGDSESDIKFGNKLGMTTVLISNDAEIGADFRFADIKSFYNALINTSFSPGGEG